MRRKTGQAMEYLEQLGNANQDVAAQLIAELGGGDVFTNSFAYDYVFNFEGITQNGSQTDTNSIDVGSGFIVTEIKMAAWYNAANTPTGFAARTKLIRNLTALPTNPALLADVGYVSVSVIQTDREWYQSPARADLVTGDIANPFILPTPIWISEKTNINVTLVNNLPSVTGVAAPLIDAQYILGGIWVEM